MDKIVKAKNGHCLFYAMLNVLEGKKREVFGGGSDAPGAAEFRAFTAQSRRAMNTEVMVPVTATYKKKKLISDLSESEMLEFIDRTGYTERDAHAWLTFLQKSGRIKRYRWETCKKRNHGGLNYGNWGRLMDGRYFQKGDNVILLGGAPTGCVVAKLASQLTDELNDEVCNPSKDKRLMDPHEDAAWQGQVNVMVEANFKGEGHAAGVRFRNRAVDVDGVVRELTVGTLLDSAMGKEKDLTVENLMRSLVRVDQMFLFDICL